ncbi:MAG: CocE/NonD family hydrolase [Planctomycetota bacterium]
MLRTSCTFTLTLLFGCLTPAFAQSPAERLLAPRQAYDTVRVPMPDGVQLVTDVFVPAKSGPFPTIFLVTPYGTTQHRELAEAWSKAGYAVVLQNQRGKGGSDGEFQPFIHETQDHSVSLEWILAQDWCDGRIGLLGTSSQSYSAQLLAATEHPAIKTLVNVSGLTDVEELFFPGGAFRLDTMYPWLFFNVLNRPIRKDSLWQERFERLPLESGFEWDSAVFEAMWNASVDTSKIRIPTMHLTGWNDVVYRQSLILRAGIEKASSGEAFQKLIVGPWMHNQIRSDQTSAGDEEFGPSALMDEARYAALVQRWFDRFLKGEENGLSEEPPVDLFVMGANEWIHREQWPPEDSSPVRFFLAAGESDGRLQTEPGEGPEASEFTFDPANPVSTMGGVNSHIFPHKAGPMDQSSFEKRSDVLVLTTEPFEAPATLAGPLRAELYVTSSAKDTDFTVKLMAVKKDGYARILEDGIRRVSTRESRTEPKLLTPGEVVRLDIDLGATAYRIDRGERLRIHVSSSNFPKYDRNPNTGEPAFSAETLEIARQKVLHSKARPSFVEVWMLEG